MTDLRLFAGVVQMCKQELGHTTLQNDHWVGWYVSKEAALGEWISETMPKWPGYSVSYQGCYDITHVAERNMDHRA